MATTIITYKVVITGEMQAETRDQVLNRIRAGLSLTPAMYDSVKSFKVETEDPFEIARPWFHEG